MDFSDIALYQILLLVLAIAFAFVCYVIWDQSKYIGALKRRITLIDAMHSALAESQVSDQAKITQLNQTIAALTKEGRDAAEM